MTVEGSGNLTNRVLVRDIFNRGNHRQQSININLINAKPLWAGLDHNIEGNYKIIRSEGV